MSMKLVSVRTATASQRTSLVTTHQGEDSGFVTVLVEERLDDERKRSSSETGARVFAKSWDEKGNRRLEPHSSQQIHLYTRATQRLSITHT